MFSHLATRKILDRYPYLQNASTHVRLLQVSSEPFETGSHVSWAQGLNGTSILPHMKLELTTKPKVRAFFLDSEGAATDENNGGQGIPLQAIVHTPNDFDEQLTFLVELGHLCRSKGPTRTSPSAIETLAYFRSRNRIWKRSVEHYNERARLMINLFFNIGTQIDSRTNLEIANLTSKIAVDAQ
ncbi:MAG: hypothetical protein L6R37_002910 [Teloschistes peruensis]|nr:MAG: hypothetical protein L6R37_002910 [Teloschistes peruensis]